MVEVDAAVVEEDVPDAQADPADPVDTEDHGEDIHEEDLPLSVMEGTLFYLGITLLPMSIITQTAMM